MRVAPRPTINTAPLEAYAAAASCWLASILSWFCEVPDWVEPLAQRSPLIARWLRFAKRRVVRGLRATASSLRVHLAAAAFFRLERMPRTRRKRLRGERGTPRRRFYRAATARFARALHCGSLRRRTARIARLFAELEALTERVTARLAALYRDGPIPRPPLFWPADASAPRMLAHAPLCADTS